MPMVHPWYSRLFFPLCLCIDSLFVRNYMYLFVLPGYVWAWEWPLRFFASRLIGECVLFDYLADKYDEFCVVELAFCDCFDDNGVFDTESIWLNADKERMQGDNSALVLFQRVDALFELGWQLQLMLTWARRGKDLGDNENNFLVCDGSKHGHFIDHWLLQL